MCVRSRCKDREKEDKKRFDLIFGGEAVERERKKKVSIFGQITEKGGVPALTRSLILSHP